MKQQVLPTALLGEIVQYLDITSDVFLPGFERLWIKATHFQNLADQMNAKKSSLCLVSYNIVNDRLHSWQDQAAIEYLDGRKEWFCRDQRHRNNGKPAIEYPDNHRVWYVRDKEILRHDPVVQHEEHENRDNMLLMLFIVLFALGWSLVFYFGQYFSEYSEY